MVGPLATPVGSGLVITSLLQVTNFTSLDIHFFHFFHCIILSVIIFTVGQSSYFQSNSTDAYFQGFIFVFLVSQQISKQQMSKMKNMKFSHKPMPMFCIIYNVIRFLLKSGRFVWNKEIQTYLLVSDSSDFLVQPTCNNIIGSWGTRLL